MSEGQWTSASAPYLTPRAEGEPDAWTAEAAARGRVGGQRILYAEEEPASDEVARMLGVPVAGRVVRRRRIIELDGVPRELTDTYYPAAIAAGTPLASTAKIRGGAVTLLAALGHVGVRVVEEVTARLPTEEERGHLRSAPGEPVLLVSRVTLDAADRPLQADVMVMPADRAQLRYETRIG
ncbi:UTRA domain-containing protein [Streptomyces sp. NBC_00536]|uniref:GntR family transcriptional regulator n=1 Tax=Streptomyces sp. NBC_00536 TaxID=2975769 RepID=UPI002E8098A9|nr:UTRA domain-containing protein [Streptomyces sp. NBC_00536]WUC78519.1 UTRA domain-containing protein [Streptomyces sp. NBC_00536]